MDDIIKNPFEEYIRQVEPGRKELRYAWYTVIGLQAVDGLKTSDYLKKTVQENIDGEITIAEADSLIESYYDESADRDVDWSKEADNLCDIFNYHRVTGSLKDEIDSKEVIVYEYQNKVRQI